MAVQTHAAMTVYASGRQEGGVTALAARLVGRAHGPVALAEVRGALDVRAAPVQPAYSHRGEVTSMHPCTLHEWLSVAGAARRLARPRRPLWRLLVVSNGVASCSLLGAC
jgi:hypothetical protein